MNEKKEVLTIGVSLVDGETVAINIGYSKNFLSFLKGDKKQRAFLLDQLFKRLNKSIDNVEDLE